jgi:hypothetical protein
MAAVDQYGRVKGVQGGTQERLKAHFRELLDPKIADPFRGGRGQIDRKIQPLDAIGVHWRVAAVTRDP